MIDFIKDWFHKLTDVEGMIRWGGYAGIDPKSLPRYLAYVERVMTAPPVAAALERERVKLDTYKVS